MRIKAGTIFTKGHDEGDAVFEYEDDQTVDVCTDDGFLVLRIDPYDLLAVAAAVKASIEFKNKLDARHNNV